jgi:anti-sigma B factor antagonist
MELTVEEKVLSPRRALLSVSGRLTAATAAGLKARIAALVSAGQVELVFDLAGLAFMDSSGLAALVSGLRLTREKGGSLHLCGLQEAVRTIFSLTMLDRVFSLHPDVNAVLGA